MSRGQGKKNANCFLDCDYMDFSFLVVLYLPRNKNLSESPNLVSFPVFGLSRLKSRLVFFVFLFGGDFRQFSLFCCPCIDFAFIWKLLRPCSNPSNLKQQINDKNVKLIQKPLQSAAAGRKFPQQFPFLHSLRTQYVH